MSLRAKRGSLKIVSLRVERGNLVECNSFLLIFLGSFSLFILIQDFICDHGLACSFDFSGADLANIEFSLHTPVGLLSDDDLIGLRERFQS